MYKSVHGSFMHNSQNMDATIDKKMDKHIVIYSCSKICKSQKAQHKKELDDDTYNNRDKSQKHAEGSQHMIKPSLITINTQASEKLKLLSLSVSHSLVTKLLAFVFFCISADGWSLCYFSPLVFPPFSSINARIIKTTLVVWWDFVFIWSRFDHSLYSLGRKRTSFFYSNLLKLYLCNATSRQTCRIKYSPL